MLFYSIHILHKNALLFPVSALLSELLRCCMNLQLLHVSQIHAAQQLSGCSFCVPSKIDLKEKHCSILRDFFPFLFLTMILLPFHWFSHVGT